MKIILFSFVAMFTLLSLSACTPTVRVEAPDKPIEINLNVNIDHNIKVKVDKELDNLIKKDDNKLF